MDFRVREKPCNRNRVLYTVRTMRSGSREDGQQDDADATETIPRAELPLSMPEHVRQRLREAIIDGTLSPGSA